LCGHRSSRREQVLTPARVRGSVPRHLFAETNKQEPEKERRDFEASLKDVKAEPRT
jgi:hypothetical protein